MLITSNNANTINAPTIFIANSHLKQLSKICFPLMLSALSASLMIFFDRIILAKYDTQMMVAATSAANIFFIFQFAAMSIAMIAEVFVGQFNGAMQFDKISKPVWQMIWFAVLCGFITIPIGIFGQSWFISPQFALHGQPYFKWMMIFGPAFPFVAALSAFFVGRGKVKIVTLSVILGNLLNCVLVMLFVFGIPGFIAPMGAKGAAIATGIAETCVGLGLLSLFLNAKHRKLYHTHRWYFDKTMFMKCLRYGFPNAIGHMFATAAWAFAMYLLAQRSVEHITIMSIGLTIWMLFSFITDGLQKGVTAIAANYIGAKRPEYLCKILMTGLRLHFLLALVLTIPLIIIPDVLVDFFIPLNDEGIDVGHLRDLIIVSCRWLWIAFIFDGMAWVIDGILTAVGDTRFIMLMNSIGTWVFCIGPIYWFVIKMDGSPILSLQLVAAFCLILFTSYYLRYKNKKWQKNTLIHK